MIEIHCKSAAIVFRATTPARKNSPAANRQLTTVLVHNPGPPLLVPSSECRAATPYVNGFSRITHLNPPHAPFTGNIAPDRNHIGNKNKFMIA